MQRGKPPFDVLMVYDGVDLMSYCNKRMELSCIDAREFLVSEVVKRESINQ